MSDTIDVPRARTAIAVAICTYKRNDLLTRLLEGLAVCADHIRNRDSIVNLDEPLPSGTHGYSRHPPKRIF